MKPDGTAKVRAVDHFSWSYAHGRKKRRRKDVKSESVNGHFSRGKSIRHDHLDDLHAASKLLFEVVGEVPGLWKVDIDAAFRRVPLKESDKWAAVVAYLLDGVAWTATHCGMPFGATASVEAWDRVGALILELARKLLRLAVFRYVDDYFGAERRELMAHAMQTLVRLVRALFGDDSISERKVECGASLVVLGIQVRVLSPRLECFLHECCYVFVL